MEQFRHIGEVLGSVKALMVLQDEIPINQRQCSLLLDIFSLAFTTIAEEIRENLRLEEKNTKWKVVEAPLRELYKIFKEGELYIRNCLDNKDWWGKAVSLHQNKDCVEFHIHNLLCCFPAVIEAIETAGEISGLDPDEMQKKRFVLEKKYGRDWNDPKLFQWKFGKQYLVPKELCRRFLSAWREDRWLLLETVREKLGSGGSVTLTKHEHRLAEMLLKKIKGSESSSDVELFPSSIMLGSNDYHVRRRLGAGGQYKETHWLGESFALRHFFGEIRLLNSEISSLLSLSHPNIVQYLCGFYDEEKKECSLVMELMSKDLCQYIKENCGPRRRMPFSLPVAVDIMLQIARGMEYLHSHKIYHGDLNPSNVFIKARSASPEGYFLAKVSGFGLSGVKNNHHHTNNSPKQNESDPFIWNAPEVLVEQEEQSYEASSKHTEKADVYSFGMLCFQLLTGKVPFEDSHLQGEKMSRNIRAGERPLFPFASPKYLANLTRKCWHSDPTQRPRFSSIVRILHHVKRFLLMNPDQGQLELPMPAVDCWELEAGFLKKYPEERSIDRAPPVSQIPFQMFAYKLVEKERTSVSLKGADWEEVTSEAPPSICGDDNLVIMEDPFSPACDKRSICSDRRSVFSEAPDKMMLSLRKIADRRPLRSPGTPKAQSPKAQSPKAQLPKAQSPKPSPLNPSGRSISLNLGKQGPLVSTPNRCRRTLRVSSSEMT